MAENGAKSRAGRPTLYREEFAEQARRLCLLGLTDEELAQFFGVAQHTIYNWDKEHPEFLQSRARGKVPADAKVAERLYHRALGYTHEAVKIFMPAGADKPVYAPYREHFPPDTQAATWWLKNRQGGRWQDKSATQQLGKDGQPVDPAVPAVAITISRNG